MDRIAAIVPYARQVFEKRMDEVVSMLRHDREKLFEWEEPADLRATLRRSVWEMEGAGSQTSSLSPLHDFARLAGEPDRGDQREALGQILDAGCTALQKLGQPEKITLSEEEELGLEAILVLYGRPALATHGGVLAPVPPFWNILDDKRDGIEQVQAAVGRIELQGSNEYDWAGTAFLVSPHIAVTALSNIEAFAKYDCWGQYFFRYGMTVSLNFHPDYERYTEASCQVVRVASILQEQELALLEVKPEHPGLALPKPLKIAEKQPDIVEGRNIYLVGYPIRDARRNEPERLARIFRDFYNVKRVQPGKLCRVFSTRGTEKIEHDCTTLGHSAGSCVIDLETHEVLGVHLSSRFLEDGFAVALWPLCNHPFLQRQAARPVVSQSSTRTERPATESQAMKVGAGVDELG